VFGRSIFGEGGCVVEDLLEGVFVEGEELGEFG